MKLKWFAIGFAIFILGIIILADLGYLRFLLRIVSRVEYLDKVLHFLLIGTLTFLVTGALIQTFSAFIKPDWLALITVIFFLVVFTIEEVSQIPIRGRDFSFKDLAANYAGILVFGFGAWWIYARKKEVLSK